MKKLSVPNKQIDTLLSAELNKLDISFEQEIESKEDCKCYSYFFISDDDFTIVKEAYDNLTADIIEKKQQKDLLNRKEVSFSMVQIVLSTFVNPIVALIMCGINYKDTIIKRILAFSLIPFILVLLFFRMIFDYSEYLNYIQLFIYLTIFLFIVLIAWEFKNTKNLVSNFKAALLNGLVLLVVTGSFVVLEIFDYNHLSRYNKLNTDSGFDIYYSDDYTTTDIEEIENYIVAYDDKMPFVTDTILFTTNGNNKCIIFMVSDYSFKQEELAILVHQGLKHELLNMDWEMHSYDMNIGRLKYWFIQQKRI